MLRVVWATRQHSLRDAVLSLEGGVVQLQFVRPSVRRVQDRNLKIIGKEFPDLL